jgi:murein DD-endopeptidase MepM/ murein hydrolase activator NlpD
MNPNEIMSLADIFGWDIDFVKDIRNGDRFGVVINRNYSNNILKESLIEHAFFKNKKRTLEAYYFNGKYYTYEGNSMRKQFLRAPIDFYRISSHFNRKRLHPIFKTVRPHLGTDYAAPTGTPIYSTGDGKVIFKGKKGGYGKTIIIKHGNIYTTLYAHMSKYKKGIRVGKKVKQKEVIGYVGSTGYSTGPHVHYEFRVRGKHKNSRTIKFKKGKKLNKKNIKKMQETHKVNGSIYSWLKEAYK